MPDEVQPVESSPDNGDFLSLPPFISCGCETPIPALDFGPVWHKGLPFRLPSRPLALLGFRVVKHRYMILEVTTRNGIDSQVWVPCRACTPDCETLHRLLMIPPSVYLSLLGRAGRLPLVTRHLSVKVREGALDGGAWPPR
jgi:hypothetical protein